MVVTFSTPHEGAHIRVPLDIHRTVAARRSWNPNDYQITPTDLLYLDVMSAANGEADLLRVPYLVEELLRALMPVPYADGLAFITDT